MAILNQIPPPGPGGKNIGAPIAGAVTPPYNPNTLTAPLTATQRAAILKYLHEVEGGNWDGYDDTQLIADYKWAVAGGRGSGILGGLGNAPGAIVGSFPNPLALAEHIWGDLSSGKFWISAGELVGGFILIAIGVHALVSDSVHPNSKHTLGSSLKQISKGPAGALKITKERTKATKSSGPRTSVSSAEASKRLKKIAEYGAK